MNFSNSAPPEKISAAQIESLQQWWNLAGVDWHYNAEPTSLLRKPVDSFKAPSPAVADTIAPTESKPIDAVKPPSETFNPSEFPDDHNQFIRWLSVSENLIESQWAKNFIAPCGPLKPEIMIIVGMPEQGDLADGSCFSPQSAALFSNMMKAIGCDSDKIYSASIAIGRTYDGRIAPQYRTDLKNRLLHHISLVQPERIIAFGETSSDLLFDENLLSARKNKQFVNHVSSKTEAIATFHPRILVERPEFKGEAWKDLQLLTRISSK
ncbi:MAG: uracil-DNA glycosylase family protein [Parasphingorhabdus sp.]|uniref:uracil-DNA glycosylase family protein n=1 Tax=Parasphingorhabdus sp. TaxID=2709688 RepID=UPI003296DF21